MTKKFIYALIALATLTACGTQRDATGQKLSKAQQQAQVASQVQQALESRHFTVEVNYMNPRRGPTHRYVQGFDLTLKGDTVVSYLPYVGEVWRAGYGPQKALNFEAPVQNYTVSRPRRDMTRIQFMAQTDEDRYDYTLEVFDNGTASIDVLAQSRDGISFDGHLKY